MNDHSMTRAGAATRWVLSAAVLWVTLGCAALAVAAPFLLTFGKNLLSTAADNYDSPYSEDIKSLLVALTNGDLAKTTTRVGGEAELPLSLDVAILLQRPGEPAPMPIEDGAVVYDGDGDDSKADRFKISCRANQECYVYVIAIDGTGWVTPVFPSAESTSTNPVRGDQGILVPAGSRWFALDAHKGIENFYFLASFVERPDITELMARFAGRTRPRKAEFRRVTEPAVATRDIQGTTAGKKTTVQAPSGASHEIIPTEFLAQVGGVDLVITRWLDHR